MKISFVVLQYGGAEDTWKCIESIEKAIDTEDYSIIIVDNNSPDNAVTYIQDRILSDNSGKIILLKNNKNEGFAKGNNIGITYARQNYDPDYIAVLNNDIELVSIQITFMLDMLYEKEKFAVLGPLVLSGDGKYKTNPMSVELLDENGIEKEIQHTKRILMLNKFYFYKLYLLYVNVKRWIKKQTGDSNNTIYKTIQWDVKLHGCFLVFTRKFFEFFTGFDPRTFLYMEEDILAVQLFSKGLHTVFVPSLVVYHKEDGTTDRLYKKSRNRIDFIYRNRLSSQQIYRSIL